MLTYFLQLIECKWVDSNIEKNTFWCNFNRRIFKSLRPKIMFFRLVMLCSNFNQKFLGFINIWLIRQ